MGNLAAWAPTNPAQVKDIQANLGLPATGQWDPETAARVSAYQQILGQTPGQTSDTDQGNEYTKLIQMIQQRGQAFNPGGDSLPMQDTGFQQFLRNAGATESELLNTIQERTLQSTREITRHAEGLKADIADTEQGYNRQAEQTAAAGQQGAQKIGQDYQGRGFISGGTSAQAQDVGVLQQDIGRQQADIAGNKAATLGKMQTGGLEWATQNRDALAAAQRGAQSDILALYRKRADEEQNARNRIGLKSAQGVYPNG